LDDLQDHSGWLNSLVVLLGEDAAAEADDGTSVRKDADHVAASLHRRRGSHTYRSQPMKLTSM
jgi:hypothetical protein